jgi:putative glycosyltransferase
LSKLLSPELSIVATIYDSERHIEEFILRCIEEAEGLVGENFEIVIVNDGSVDKGLEIALEKAKEDNRIVIIDLSRNFGHHRAMMIGLSYAKGNKIFLIDSDLEEDPKWLHDLHKKMNATNSDIVYGIQAKRKGKIFERMSGELLYRIFIFLTGYDLPKNAVTARLMTRRYLDALLLHQEREIFLTGLCYITGFHQEKLFVNKKSSSLTTYSFRKKLALALTSLTSFTNLPLISIFYVGFSLLMLSIIYIIFLMVDYLFFNNSLTGWVLVMGSIWFLGGILVSSIGILGVYLSRIFTEVKGRPYSIVREVHNRKDI